MKTKPSIAIKRDDKYIYFKFKDINVKEFIKRIERNNTDITKVQTIRALISCYSLRNLTYLTCGYSGVRFDFSALFREQKETYTGVVKAAHYGNIVNTLSIDKYFKIVFPDIFTQTPQERVQLINKVFLI